MRTYLQFYNNEKLHQSFGGKIPAKVCWGEETVKKVS